MSSFEHVNFSINEKYSVKLYDNLNYYVSLVIFQTYKNKVLRNVHSLGWLFWLWFYTYAILWFFIKFCTCLGCRTLLLYMGKKLWLIYDNPNQNEIHLQQYNNSTLRNTLQIKQTKCKRNLHQTPKTLQNKNTMLYNLKSQKMFSNHMTWDYLKPGSHYNHFQSNFPNLPTIIGM